VWWPASKPPILEGFQPLDLPPQSAAVRDVVGSVEWRRFELRMFLFQRFRLGCELRPFGLPVVVRPRYHRQTPRTFGEGRAHRRWGSRVTPGPGGAGCSP